MQYMLYAVGGNHYIGKYGSSPGRKGSKPELPCECCGPFKDVVHTIYG